MPKDNIERVLKRAEGGEGEAYDEIRYEGYGPGGTALIVESMTDNRNRTASEVRPLSTNMVARSVRRGPSASCLTVLDR